MRVHSLKYLRLHVTVAFTLRLFYCGSHFVTVAAIIRELYIVARTGEILFN